MKLTVLVGAILFAAALYDLPYGSLDLLFAVILVCTIGFGSRISVKIPRLKSHISVSDTFIFLTLILYGGEAAIIVAALDAFASSYRFCNRFLTILFNSAAMAISIAVVFVTLKATGFYTEFQLRGEPGHLTDFLAALSLMAVVQFGVNTTLASLYDLIKEGRNIWENWKTKYLWSFVTYLFGAAGAGLLVQLIAAAGVLAVFAAIPLIFFSFMTYRMYLQNVEMSIAETKRAEEYAHEIEQRSAALEESEERFRSAFDHAPIGIGLVSPAGKWLKANRALCRILGYSADELVAMTFQDVVSPDDLGPSMIKIGDILTGRQPSCEMEQRYIHSTGRTVWTSWSVSTTSREASETADLIFQIQDITDKKVAEERLQHEASHDSLTGLPNRAHFMQRLSVALKKAGRSAESNVSVLFIDLDRFKNVNDSLGHLVGDELLIKIASRLKECLRPGDVVARLGGDEFTILVEGRHDLSEVSQIAERIQRKFSLPFEIRGNLIYSSASIGLLTASDRYRSAEEMMRDADTAMYHAKRSGKARHEVFDEKMHAEARETLRLETDLRRAIEEEQITVDYQPIFCLDTNDLVGVEALARWRHPEFGNITPTRFIRLAEEIGWIDTLGEQIMRRSVSDIGPLLSLPSTPELKLSVNLSCQQFATRSLVRRILSVLDETGFPSTRLRLEITESVFFEYQDRAIEMLHNLRGFGIEIDIDDFGTGYSNLGYLVRLPISTLKVDRSFVKAMGADGANSEIVETIVSLAKNLGLTVTAEGIETESHLNVLKKMRCERGQGYLFARPMGIDEFRDYLSASGERIFTEVPGSDITHHPVVQ